MFSSFSLKIFYRFPAGFSLRCLSSASDASNTSNALNSSTVKVEKVNYYDGLASKWRNTTCVKAGLEFRKQFITHGLIHGNSHVSSVLKLKGTTQLPLTGIKIIDVGCGAGMVSQCMAELGASVTGIDPAVHMVEVAKLFAEKSGIPDERLEYFNETTDDHVKNNSGKYDAVLIMTILEHIQNHQQFLDNCVKLIKPNGSVFIHHINKTWSSVFLFDIWGGRIAKVGPKGAITYQQLMKTDDIVNILKSINCETVQIRGSRMTLSGGGKWTNSKKYGNFIHAIKKN
ncbi:Hexaprenyldihydroxybenzoate methyltransferase, mitochondrial [Chamberlinius hualienensis]